MPFRFWLDCFELNIFLIWILSVFESICWPWYLEVFVSVYLWGTGLFAVSVGAKKYSFLALKYSQKVKISLYPGSQNGELCFSAHSYY